ncbi:MAG: 2Fe-2S iron-sulfur cluster-binding protein, partial [Nannocystaceae bacterium]
MGRLHARWTKVRRSRLEQLRADLEMVWRGVAGRAPAPFEDRRGRTASRWRATAASAEVRGARVHPSADLEGALYVVDRRVKETEDAVSLWLRPSDGGRARALAGQFFTVRVPHPDGVLKRAYSASHRCGETDTVRITIQRVAGGVASTYLTEEVGEGDTLRLLGPSGDFGADMRSGAVRRVVMIAGGSGVTPLAALCHTRLAAQQGACEIVLVHGIRSPRHALLANELTRLARDSGGSFTVRHVVEHDAPAEDELSGRLNGEVLEQALDWAVNSMSAPPERYLVCGPPGLLEVVHSCLRARGIPESHVDQERFASPELDEGFEDEAQHTVTFRTEDGELVGQGPASVTILRRGLDVGVAMPFSCTMGGCGACKVRLVEGAVSMEMPNCLTEE